jgi:hypothetical protein
LSKKQDAKDNGNKRKINEIINKNKDEREKKKDKNTNRENKQNKHNKLNKGKNENINEKKKI